MTKPVNCFNREGYQEVLRRDDENLKKILEFDNEKYSLAQGPEFDDLKERLKNVVASLVWRHTLEASNELQNIRQELERRYDEALKTEQMMDSFYLL